MDINIKTGAAHYFVQGIKYFFITLVAVVIILLIGFLIYSNISLDISPGMLISQPIIAAVILVVIVLVFSVLIAWLIAEPSIARKQQYDKLLACLKALDSSSDSILINDISGKIIYFNESASISLGLKKRGSQANNFNSLIAQDFLSAVYEQLQKLDIVNPISYEAVLVRENGAFVPVEIHSQIILLQGKRYILSVIKDISAQKQKAEELKISSEKLKNAMEGTINTLALAAEVRDPYTAGHQQRVSLLAVAIANELGLSEDQREGIRVASSLHDIGKIYVPAEILSKPGKLKVNEFNLVRDHAEVGYELLRSIEFPWPVAEIILQHHERFNGSGYPRGLRGDDIMLEASIIAVCDVVESMASHRPYRPAFHIEKALLEILQNKGILYHPDVVDACLNLFNEKGFNF